MPRELMVGIKLKLSNSKLPIFGCTDLMMKRVKDVINLEPMALEGKFLGYTGGDTGYLLYLPKTRREVAFRDFIVKDSTKWAHFLTTQRRSAY